MNLYRRYFDLTVAGRKTIEARVLNSALRKLVAGDHVRFACGRAEVLTVARRVARYRPLEDMLGYEDSEKVKPEQRASTIRR